MRLKRMPELLTAKDLQTLLQVDRSTIYRMAEAKRLPAIKVGKQWRFPADRIESWLQGQTVNLIRGSVPAPNGTGESLASRLPLACVQLIQDTLAQALGAMIVGLRTCKAIPSPRLATRAGFLK